MEINRQGCTRLVILIGPWAIKLPRFGYGWRLGLTGLLCNMAEVRAWTMRAPELCPIVAHVPGGFALVMRRARPLTEAEWTAFDFDRFCDPGPYVVPAERKRDSFGVLDGRIVAVDYGS